MSGLPAACTRYENLQVRTNSGKFIASIRIRGAEVRREIRARGFIARFASPSNHEPLVRYLDSLRFRGYDREKAGEKGNVNVRRKKTCAAGSFPRQIDLIYARASG